MTYLLSEEGRRALSGVLTGSLLYAFDFDGTLTPISSQRDAVTLPHSVREWLNELAKRVPCAVVSGRSLADLAPRLDGAVPYLIGNHGIESPIAAPGSLVAAEKICRTWKEAVETQFAQPFKDLGVELEDKRYSLTFHFREMSDASAVHLSVAELLRRLTPLPRLVPGKSSINALPPGSGGKGAAARALMVHLGQSGLLFVGDDDTDEEVFGLTEGLVIGVRIGRLAGSRAGYYLNDQGEIEDLLRFLVLQIRRSAWLVQGTADGRGFGSVHDR